jgi:hypothetical protein
LVRYSASRIELSWWEDRGGGLPSADRPHVNFELKIKSFELKEGKTRHHRDTEGANAAAASFEFWVLNSELSSTTEQAKDTEGVKGGDFSAEGAREGKL